MTEISAAPKKVHPENEDLENLSKAELMARIKEQDQYIKQLESKKAKLDKGEDDADFGDKLKQQQKEAARRENTLVHRLTTKEQELQDYMNQIAEMKQAQTQGTSQLKSMLLDPAVNTVFQRMAKELEEAQEKLKQTQNELSAWKFTPDSQTGKRLMARCQMLLQENEELGKTISSGRTAKLEGEIALQKTLVTEMKNNQSELDEFLGDLEEDVEGMQTMIYVLQQQLREAKEQITSLEDENTRLRAGDTSVPPTKTLTKKSDKQNEMPVIKTENMNQNAYSEKRTSEYSPMETKFYQEKTDSDLEAEYNYEGLYENEDKYQEETEEPTQSVEGGNYEYDENGYQNYAEEFAEQDYKSEDETAPEPMETEDTHQATSVKKTHSPTTNGTTRRSSPTPNSVLTDVTKSDISSDQSERTSQQCNSSSTDIRQHEGDSGAVTRHSPHTSSPVTETKSMETCSKQVDNQTTSDSTSCNQSLENNPKTPENSARIPSPKPTKVSPVKTAASKQMTSLDDNGHRDKLNGSPTNSSSPHRTGSSPNGSNQTTGSEEKTSDGSRPSQIANDRSPGSTSGVQKDREPVLQKFLNGVTSTVDDIEDI